MNISPSLAGVALAALLGCFGVTGCGGGSASSTAAVSAPVITTQPSSISVAVGASATFTVVATGSGTLAYQWYLGTTAISGATSATLAMTALTTADAGDYTVTVTNSTGTTTSASATLTVLAAAWNLTTGANSLDLVAGTTFDYTVAIALDTLTITTSDPTLVVGTETDDVTPITLNGSQVMTVTKDSYGLALDSDMPDGVHVELLLSGTYNGSITIFSLEPFKLGLNGADITSPNGPALNIQSSERAFVVLYPGTSNTLTDSSTYSTRYLSDGITAMELKAACFSEGPLVLSGTGSMTATGNKKHALCSDAHVRMCEGTLDLIGNKKDGIHTNNAFIMDGGTLTIATSSGAGKGIKVEGKEDTTQALGFIIVNDGTVTINSYDKAMTAGWEAADDATTTTTVDDPDPFVTINGGTINITTFGTPYEDTDTSDGDSSLSPEGIESKSTLTVNGGTLSVVTTDDALNAIKALVINGGTIYAKGTANDAVDSNGTLTITGGVLVADGSNGAEGGLDCDENTFKVTGGTFLGLGGRNSTPTAAACTQNTVSLGSGTVNTLVVVKDGSGNIAMAFRVPYTCTAMLVSSALFKTGTTYTVYTGGTLGAYTTLFNGLYLGASGYSGGTSGRSFTIGSAYTSL